MSNDSAIEFFIGKKVQHHVADTLTEEVRRVKLIALGEGYAMVRRSGCYPYVCKQKDLKPITK